MKISATAAALSRALGHTKEAVERRNTIPVLSNVLLEAAGGSLRMTATDMGLWVEDAVNAEIVRPGRVTVAAHSLAGFLDTLPGDDVVDLETIEDGAQCAIRCRRARARLSVLPPEDFPVRGGHARTHSFDLAPEVLLSLFARTAFAISTEETRYYLNGIYLHQADPEGRPPCLCAVATDGHRLALAEAELPEGATGMPGLILPRRTIKLIQKTVAKDAGPLAIVLGETWFELRQGALVISSKVIDGTFPDYRRVIPTDNDKTVSLPRAGIAAAAARVVSIMSEKIRAVNLTIGDGALTFAASSPEHGDCVEEVELDYAGAGMEIGFNARYLSEALDRIEGNIVDLALSDPASPALLTDPVDKATTYVLMPMRV